MLQPTPPDRVVSFFFSLLSPHSCCFYAASTLPYIHISPNPKKTKNPPPFFFFHTLVHLQSPYREVPCMFAPNGSNPMAPSGRITKQTSLDSFSRPSTRLARKEAKAKGSGETSLDAHNRPRPKAHGKVAGAGDVGPIKEKTKQKVAGT